MIKMMPIMIATNDIFLLLFFKMDNNVFFVVYAFLFVTTEVQMVPKADSRATSKVSAPGRPVGGKW